MLSPFCCMISCHIGTNIRVPTVGSPICNRKIGTRNYRRWASKGAEDACVHFFSVVASCDRHLHLRQRWSNSDASLIFGLKSASFKCCTLRPLGTKKVMFETASEEASQKEPTNAATKFAWIGLPAVTLTLNAVFGGQPAYADFRPIALAQVGAQMEVIRDSAPSVEAILAKQLARRFREMSDEELVDILQQLLKASRSSFSPQSAVDDGIVPEDLLIQKPKKRTEIKTAEKIREEVRVPGTQDIDTNHGKEVKDTNTSSETQPANLQGQKNTRERIGGEAVLPQTERINGQVFKKTNGKVQVNGTEPQDQASSEEKIPSGTLLSETQKTLRSRNAASTVPPTGENYPGDVSANSKSDLSDTSGRTGAAELSSSKSDDRAKEGSREDEDLTELLWAEWSRRAGSEVVQEPQTSRNSFNIVEFGQGVISKLVALTALQRTVGVVTIWSCFLVLAFYLGRSRAASMKDIPKSKEALMNNKEDRNSPVVSSRGRTRGDSELESATLSKDSDFFQDSGNARISGLKEFISNGKRILNTSKREEDYGEGIFPGEGESSMKVDQPENRKWWMTPWGESFLSDGNETSVTKIQGAVDTVPRRSSLEGRGEDLNYLSNSSRTRTRSESRSSVGREGDLNYAISTEPKQLQDDLSGEEPSGGSKRPFYPPGASVNTVDINRSELQAPGGQPRHGGSQLPWQADWRSATLKDTSNYSSSGEEREQGDASTSASEYANSMAEMAIIDFSENMKFDHGRAISPNGAVNSTKSMGTATNLGFQTTSPKQIPINPPKQVDVDWEKMSSKRFGRDLDSSEQVGHKDSLGGVNAQQHGASEVEDSAASQSNSDLNSFVHDHVLWVRDDDGIFIQQAAAMEEEEGIKFKNFSVGEHDMSESTQPSDATTDRREVGSSNLPASIGPLKRRKRSVTGFDYRRLIIDSRDKFAPNDQQGLATESEPVRPRPQTRPLGYGSGKQKGIAMSNK